MGNLNSVQHLGSSKPTETCARAADPRTQNRLLRQPARQLTETAEHQQELTKGFIHCLLISCAYGTVNLSELIGEITVARLSYVIMCNEVF